MAVTDIKEIRILPPLAIGRFGGSAEPMHNYDAVVTSATGFRELRPAETLLLNPNTGEIVAKQTPLAVRFKDGSGRVKPVCPFVEVWARYEDDGDFLPLTLRELRDLNNRNAAALSWEVTVANLKILRRTGDPRDRITATVPAFSDHQRQKLVGKSGNFKSNGTVDFGSVQYVNPTDNFPEIRLRFTPSVGLVFGTTASDVIPEGRAVYNDSQGRWRGYFDRNVPQQTTDPRARLPTSPGGIYARNPQGRSLGYLDDSCDGVIKVTLTLADDRRLTSFARICAGPPDFAPDSFPIRTMAEELEQMVLGPQAADVSAEDVLDIVRRAFETIRLADTRNLNEVWGTEFNDFPPPFADDEARYTRTRPIHQSLLQTLSDGLSAPADSTARRNAHNTLVRINDILRDSDNVTDRTRTARRRMPGMMRGADGMHLALNRRQRSKIARAVEVFKPTPPLTPGTDSNEVRSMKQMIVTLNAFAMLHAGFTLDNRTLADRFADPPAVLDYLQRGVAQGSVSTGAGLAGRPLVVPGDPAGSAFLVAIKRTEHPMNSQLSSYRDPITGKSGLVIVEEWIVALGSGV